MISRIFADMDGAAIFCGFEGEHYSGMPAADLGEVLAKGTRDGHIPERDFYTPTQDRVESVAREALRASLDAALAGGDPRRALAAGAREAHDILAQEIRNFSGRRNAASTVARKGKDTPLVDSGSLLGATVGGYEIP